LSSNCTRFSGIEVSSGAGASNQFASLRGLAWRQSEGRPKVPRQMPRAFGATYRDDAIKAVVRARLAFHIAAIAERGELGFRRAAQPGFAVGPVAALAPLRRIDAQDAVLGAIARPQRVAADGDDHRAEAERLGLRDAIALDEDHSEHDERKRDELAERLGKLERRLAVAFGLLIFAFGSP